MAMKPELADSPQGSKTTFVRELSGKRLSFERGLSVSERDTGVS